MNKWYSDWRIIVTGLCVALSLVLGAMPRPGDAARELWNASGEYPSSLEELNATYHDVPEEENGASTYQAAFDAEVHEMAPEVLKNLPICGTGDAEVPDYPEPVSTEMRQAIAEFVSLNEQTLNLLHKAGGMPHCRFPIDFTEGYHVGLPHLAHLRQGARLFSLESLHAAITGDASRAAKAIAAAAGMGRALENEPMLISQLVRSAIFAIACGALEEDLNRADFDEQHLVQLSEAFEGAWRMGMYGRAIAGDLTMGSAFIREDYLLALSQNERQTSSYPIHATSAALQWTGLRDVDLLVYDSMARDTVRAGDAKRFDDLLEETWKFDDTTEILYGAQVAPLAAIMIPALMRAYQAEWRTLAHQRLALTALAIETHRVREGHLPESLTTLYSETLPESAIDPFNEKPLIYRPGAEGFLLYSVGEDLLDDGGAFKRGTGIGDWNICVRVPEPVYEAKPVFGVPASERDKTRSAHR